MPTGGKAAAAWGSNSGALGLASGASPPWPPRRVLPRPPAVPKAHLQVGFPGRRSALPGQAAPQGSCWVRSHLR